MYRHAHRIHTHHMYSSLIKTPALKRFLHGMMNVLFWMKYIHDEYATKKKTAKMNRHAFKRYLDGQHSLSCIAGRACTFMRRLMQALTTPPQKKSACKRALKTNHTQTDRENARKRQRDSHAHENTGSPRRHARVHTHTHTYTHTGTNRDLTQGLVLGEQPVEELIVCYKLSQPVTSSVSSLHRHTIL